MKKLLKLKWAALSFLAAFTALPAGGWLFVPEPKGLDFPVSPTLLDRQGQIFHARLSANEEWLLPVPLSDMGPWLPKVTVAIEDRRFRTHPGLDALAILRALRQNRAARRVVSGASTITAQVVRMSQPRPRTPAGKYVEFIQALKLERKFSKDKILEAYLNRAPFGGNLRGAEAAARFYFDKRARDLSLGESVLLAALLRGPSLYRPDRNPAWAEKRRNGLLEILEKRGVISAREAAQAKLEPVTGRQGRLPRQAWHLAEHILAKERPLALWRWEKGRYGLKTSLDADLQHLLEMRLSQGLADFPGRITGAGAIMDNRNGEILAYVGNARRLENAGRHWVDCGLAPRSPGSTLKPFIYLAAFDELGLTPASLIADTPLELSGQAPRNFDEYYRGPVSVQTALSQSLNVPAVRVLRQLGQKRALAAIRRAGFEFAHPGGPYYGDSLALGGNEVNLWQMLKAYGTLARQGLAVEPACRLAEPSSPEAGRRVFAAGPAWLVNECLKDNSRLPAGLRLGWEQSFNSEPAFKTGTSHGLRDAWLAAYTPEYTLIMWLGDPWGQAHPGLAALKALGPLAIPIMKDLHARRPLCWPPPPEEVETYQACQLSGQPVGPHCPGSYPAYRLKAGAKSHPCRLHIARQGREETLWPPELAGFAASRSARLTSVSEPSITSPLPGGVIILERGGDKIPLRCEGAQGRVHWFVDDEFLASGEAGFTPVLPLSPGAHKVSLVDSRNRTAGAEFTVKFAQDRDRDQDLPILNFN